MKKKLISLSMVLALCLSLCVNTTVSDAKIKAYTLKNYGKTYQITAVNRNPDRPLSDVDNERVAVIGDVAGYNYIPLFQDRIFKAGTEKLLSGKTYSDGLIPSTTATSVKIPATGEYAGILSNDLEWFIRVRMARGPEGTGGKWVRIKTSVADYNSNITLFFRPLLWYWNKVMQADNGPSNLAPADIYVFACRKGEQGSKRFYLKKPGSSKKLNLADSCWLDGGWN